MVDGPPNTASGSDPSWLGSWSPEWRWIIGGLGTIVLSWLLDYTLWLRANGDLVFAGEVALFVMGWTLTFMGLLSQQPLINRLGLATLVYVGAGLLWLIVLPFVLPTGGVSSPREALASVLLWPLQLAAHLDILHVDVRS